MNLIELTHKNDILQTYEIYKHCMFMPTEEKFNKKVEQFLNNNSVKIFACFSHGKLISLHTVMNKITGLLLFLLPPALQFIEIKYSLIAVCIVATISAIQEGYYIRTGQEV